jgi:hypothetical protein
LSSGSIRVTSNHHQQQQQRQQFGDLALDPIETVQKGGIGQQPSQA